MVPIIKNSNGLWNSYGPTETTIYSSSQNFNGIVPYGPDGRLLIPIGKPMKNVGGNLNWVHSDDALTLALSTSWRCLRSPI